MSAGAVISKQQIDDAITSIGTNLHVSMVKATQFKDFLDSILDADLTTRGYSAADIANLRTAVTDIAQLSDIFNGISNLVVAKDFRTFLRRVWGFGFNF